MANPYEAPGQAADTDISKHLGKSLRSFQIVTAALIQGAVIVWAIMLFTENADFSGQPGVMAYVGLGIAALVVLLHLVVPPIIEQSRIDALKKDSDRPSEFSEQCSKVVSAIQMPHFFKCAVLEGGSVFNAVAYLIDNWIGNVIAGGVLIALILIRFPTRTSITFKVQDRLREIEA